MQRKWALPPARFKIMSEKPSYSRIRIALAQFLFANQIELEELYDALGVDTSDTDPGAISHIAGVLDGMNVASTRIRQHGLDNWSKGNS